MKNNSSTLDLVDHRSFEFSCYDKIDAKKYTLYDVLADPKLDKLKISSRLSIFNSFQDDLVLNRMANYNRYALNGSRTERSILDPSTGQTRNMINFGSNDYLNMSQNHLVIKAGIEALKQYGAGAGSSSNASGRTEIKVELEKEIADALGYESALVYPTGFMANIGVLGAMLRSNDIAVVDMLAHASIMDGITDRHKMLFRHNNMHSLETILRRVNRQYTNKIVVVDGVYSMDGDIANLPDIAGLCEKYDALLMVDEAHAFGVIGKNGMGILDHFNMPPETIDILTGTLSKAVGCSGGFVAGKKELINYLNIASRAHFFTTAPFVASNGSALESIRIIRQDPERRENLWKNINYFKSKLSQSGFNTGNAETAIFPVILGNHNMVIDVTRNMGDNGVLVNGIPYPAVPRKQTRIRMTVSSEMTSEQLDKGYFELCNAVDKYKKEEINNQQSLQLQELAKEYSQS